jgi:hypothetical protein
MLRFQVTSHLAPRQRMLSRIYGRMEEKFINKFNRLLFDVGGAVEFALCRSGLSRLP